ncbi:hypothetical protein DPMN_038134 [Dreissena polymorpha]|uniref:Uncharacterized protein n=1 Tax=Dreissena polymorpha TaxID=45954 RepID=A0A9D4MEV3_DREPO|nr:hypothetical protein DPMN_038134 [Dreissena polymorpha]
MLPHGYSTVHDHFPIAIRPYTSSCHDLYPIRSTSTRVILDRITIWSCEDLVAIELRSTWSS